MHTETPETLTAMKTVELRKLAGQLGIRKMSSARKEQLVPAIIAFWEEESRRNGVREALDNAATEGWTGSVKPAKKASQATTQRRQAAEISAKALAFEADAKAAGWSAIARNAADGSGVSVVTARASDGRELELRWLGKACVDGQNFFKRTDGKKVKIRNASAARKILTES